MDSFSGASDTSLTLGCEKLNLRTLSTQNVSSVSELTDEISKNKIGPIKSRNRSSISDKFSLKPIRLSDWTQELLEAENEPLKPLILTVEEDVNEGNAESPGKTVPEVPVIKHSLNTTITNLIEKKTVQCGDSFDLGVSWLETPLETVTDGANDKHELLNTPLVKKSEIQFSTPQLVIAPTTTKDSTFTKPKIQYSINIKHLPNTPMNKALTNQMYPQSVPQSLRTPNNPILKNVCANTISAANKISSITRKSSHVVLKEQKENHIKNNVNVFVPEVKLNSSDFKIIVVKDTSYVILNQLGRGGSSVVYHCYDLSSKCERAIKKVNLSEDSNAMGYINEVKMLEKLQKCDRIITMYDYEIIQSEKALLVVLERGGLDLAKILNDLCAGDKNLPVHMLIFYWMEMLYAVKQIHENGIIHSDLKPGNFLKAEGGLKLIDFGIASCIQNDMTSVARDIAIGSFNYISPEALTNQSSNDCQSPNFGKPKYKVSYKSDVWSLGCILYQLVYRKTPFHHINHAWAKLATIIDPQHQINYPEVSWIPQRILNTIKNCLKYNMKERPSINELIQEYENIYS